MTILGENYDERFGFDFDRPDEPDFYDEPYPWEEYGFDEYIENGTFPVEGMEQY